MERKIAWEKYSQEEMDKVFTFAEDYRQFLSHGKTERECVKLAVAEAKAHGYEDLNDVIAAGKTLKAGDKVYSVCMGKTLAMFQIGEEPLENGMNIVGAHIDSPRIDLKQNPLYEDNDMAMFDTHYYGGIKKYQWVALPLALYGVVAKKDGTTVDIAIGDDHGDPVFGISDLLPHLAREQMAKTAAKIIEGEDLNLLIGSIPVKGEEKEAVKKNILAILKEKYDITLERVPMDIDAILSQLSGEISTDKKDGDIDMIWINGENFKTCKENNMLYGPFAEELPNFQSYIDTDDEETNADFCFPIEGYEAPYGKAQLVMIADTAVTPDLPTNTDEFMEFCKANKGKVTYPALPDFTGSAFVRNVIYDICGYEQFMDMEADKETVKAAIEPALEYLRELNPYLWNEGKTFPKDSTALTNMYSDGEVVMDISYSAYSTATNIENGTYTETSQSFQFDKGTIGNTNYIAIAANSGNVAGAQVAINEMMDPEVQADRFTEIRTIPVVDYKKLNDTQKEAFDKVEIGKGVISQDELLSKRLPEMPSALVPIIEEIWAEEVVGK